MTIRRLLLATFHYFVQTRGNVRDTEPESGEGFEFDMQIIAAGS